MANEIRAVDLHGHYGIYRSSRPALINRRMSGNAREVASRARPAGIVLTAVSPLGGLMIRSPADVLAANRDAARQAESVPGLAQWVIVHPLDPRTYEQAAEMLKHPRCVGIKIHPELHGYPIRKHGRKLFEFAEKRGAMLLTHSGQERSLPRDFAGFADEHPGVRLILAHMGFGYDQDVGHHARVIQRSRHGNVFADTSSMMSLLPGLVEWGLREVGADRLVFGTDTPLYSAQMHRMSVERACARMSDRRRILRDNALALLRFAKGQRVAAIIAEGCFNEK